MEMSTYDPCFVIAQGKLFGLFYMQTDDTLILGDDEFLELENNKLQNSKLLVKPLETLAAANAPTSNRYKLTREPDAAYLTQKFQASQTMLVDLHRYYIINAI